MDHSLDGLPPELARDGLSWIPRGSGVFRWLVFDVYHVRLYTLGAASPLEGPKALTFDFMRRADAATLILATTSEIQRIRAPGTALVERWAQALQAIIPEIPRGERLTAANAALDIVRFYVGGRPVGDLVDAEFPAAFFAIWLDASTRSPDLRRALLGDSSG